LLLAVQCHRAHVRACKYTETAANASLQVQYRLDIVRIEANGAEATRLDATLTPLAELPVEMGLEV
jgi:hypothetical protein